MSGGAWAQVMQERAKRKAEEIRAAYHVFILQFVMQRQMRHIIGLLSGWQRPPDLGTIELKGA
eukprot:1160421-Pelagomonas_calceolata.AAC.5